MRFAYGFVAAGLSALLAGGGLIPPADGGSLLASEPEEAAAVRRFESEIAPLLAKHCLECHDAASKKGGLDLSRKQAAFAGGESGSALTPRKADQSLLWQYVESDEMPPEKRPKLSDDEKRLLREWIDSGADWSLDVIDPSANPGNGRAADDLPRRLTVPEYIETVRATVGINIDEDARRLLPADLRVDGFTNTAYSLGVDLKHVEAYAELAEIIVGRLDVAKFTAGHASCRSLDDRCLREIISRVGKRLLRGPLVEEEVTAYLAVAKVVRDEGGNFDEAMRYVLQSMLQSPRFVYLIESRRGDGSVRRPSDHELASRLSYILWGGPPDDELMRAADAGELSSRRRVAAQVQRMLRDPRAVVRSARFIHDWLDLDRLGSLRPDSERFPSWDERLAADMCDETLAYFKYVAWEQNRPLSDLMNAQVTFATPRLARHYGLTNDQLVVDPKGAGNLNALTGPQRITEGLLAVYRFDEGSGDTVRDSSGSSEPVHLKIPEPSAVRWDRDGLAVLSPTVVVSSDPPRRMIDAIKTSGEITIEVWVTPADATQKGPARIVSLSADTMQRNFTLGQEADTFHARLRTTKTDGSGMPSLDGPPAVAGTARVHVVYTREESGKAKLYVNGEKKATRDVGGDFSNWDGSFQLTLANELTKDRPWRGTLHLAAVYDRALSTEEVRRNRAAGTGRGESLAAAPINGNALRKEGLQALYRFDEGTGDSVRDVSGAGEPLDLKIENTSAVRWGEQGLNVVSPTLVATPGPPKRLIEAIKKSTAFTLEAWVAPADTKQAGPARVITLSNGVSTRNFTLGQDGDKFEVQFRTTKADTNGLPGLASPRGAARTKLTHVVYTRESSGKAKLYVDGEEEASRDVHGDPSNWDGGFRLMLANESSKDRPWQGTLRLVAIYDRALGADRVRRLSKQDPTKVDAPAETVKVAGERSATGDSLARYDLSSVHGRGGLLTQGSVLTIGGDDASMVTRGLFVLHELLDSRVGNPPPCADTTPVPTGPGLTRRAVAEKRIADVSCGGCHSKIEPLAFGLERFDGIAAYLEKDEHGNALREDGEVLFPGAERPTSYRTSAELMDLLADSERVRRCIARKVTQFAIGRPLVQADEPILDRIAVESEEGGGTYASLITAVVMSDLIQMTRTEASE